MSAKKSELTLTKDDIYEEHQKAVNPLAHWTYLFAVLGGGVLLMLLLMALLGST